MDKYGIEFLLNLTFIWLEKHLVEYNWKHNLASDLILKTATLMLKNERLSNKSSSGFWHLEIEYLFEEILNSRSISGCRAGYCKII